MRELKSFEKATMVTTGMASALALAAGAGQVQADPFNGFYLGLSASGLSGRLPFGDTYDDYNMESDVTPGMFLGYNKTLANGLVVGGELAFQGATPGNEDGGSSYDTYGIGNVVDLKAKVGKTLTAGSMPILLYGFAGMSVGNTAAYYGDYDFSGYNYGLGAEMGIGENFSVGLEFLGRSVESYNGYDGDQTTQHQQVSLRGAFHF